MTDLRFRPVVVDEEAIVAQQSVTSFGDDDRDVGALLRPRIAAGELWGVEEAGELKGYCRLLLVDHWFGGRRVPAMDIASVSVPPEHRGRGVASALMRGALDWGVHQGAAISTLFPSTARLYRRLGWEHAGSFTLYRIDARLAPATGEALRPLTPADWPAVIACHERHASRLQGPWVRPDDRWQRLRKARFGYVLDGATGIEAYVLLGHTEERDGWRYTLSVADWAATTPRGMRAIVAFIGRHGTVGKDATLTGPVPDAWPLWTEEQHDVTPVDAFFWMARGLLVADAIAARGFLPGVTADVTLRIEDPLLAEARGPWRLRVADGRGTLEPTQTADVVLEARAFGPLFTGFRSPRQLALAGLLDGPHRSLDALTAAFAGPSPQLLDYF